jgi:hypothetical protein
MTEPEPDVRTSHRECGEELPQNYSQGVWVDRSKGSHGSQVREGSEPGKERAGAR